LQQAQKEAQAAFGDGSLYVEKFLTRVRHIEVQVLGDETTTLHLGERDCSTQRRNQKLVEETPAPGLDAAMRNEMCEAAARLARSVGYTSAGNVEFIVDDAAHCVLLHGDEHSHPGRASGDRDGERLGSRARADPYCAGEGVGMTQRDVASHGHAIECRINAEDPRTTSGRRRDRHRISLPGGPGVRVDSQLFPATRFRRTTIR
jgi:acetyl-CoA carboxylase biotin carboxylase subunit